ncbi:MAG: hypothetical protein ABSD03_12410 [Vulcanimicrobiaceae bacterium]
MTSNAGWTGVDLDGTLAEHYWPEKGAFAIDRIGDPIAPMVERVKAWIAEGIEVRIFTARVGPQPCDSGRSCGPFTFGRCLMCHKEDVRERAWVAIAAWTREHIGVELPATVTKDFGMVELWDDRAVRVVTNTGHRCCNVAAAESHDTAMLTWAFVNMPTEYGAIAKAYEARAGAA